MLIDVFNPAVLARSLLPREQWIHHPTASRRAAWSALAAETRDALISDGDEALRCETPHLPLRGYRDYLRDGNRSRYEQPYFRRRGSLAALVLAECAEYEGRFLEAILDLVWSLCEETSWCVPAHQSGVPDARRPVIDLFAAETAALLAWTDALLRTELDSVGPEAMARARLEIDRRLLTPALERDWGWMGFDRGAGRPNNWNPWIVSNWLTCALLLAEPEERRIASVSRAVACLDCFLEPYPDDGGCDEGPSYWGRAAASLLDGLDLLHSAVDRSVNPYDIPKIREMGRFIYRAHIADTFYVNFADAPSRMVPSANTIYGYGLRVDDPDLSAFGAWLKQFSPGAKASMRTTLARRLQALFDFPIPPSAPAYAPLPRDAWLPDTQLMVARDREGQAGGWFVAAKGGHNAESHNHNDVGTLIVFHDAQPLIVDVGVGVYTRQTFSRERYSIWTMQSAYHNLLPTFDGVMQAAGKEFAASNPLYSVAEETAEFGIELQKAYPPEAGVLRWLRNIRLERGKQVVVEDRFSCRKHVGDITLSVLTPSEPVSDGSGGFLLKGRELPRMARSADGHIAFCGDIASHAAEILPIDDSRLCEPWGERLYRIVIQVKSNGAEPSKLVTVISKARA